MKTLDSYPDEVKKQVEYFLHNSDLERMSRTVRKLFFAYLRNSHDGLSVDFDNVLYDVETIIELFEDLNDSISSINE